VCIQIVTATRNLVYTSATMGTFWELSTLRTRNIDRVERYEIDFKEDWSGRPGSNRRRPAWEFGIEFDVLSFCGKSLVDVFCH
jgi:hypothetical protein